MAKILIIDDDDEARATIREMLERESFEVIEASNGKEGLKMIEQNVPDVVVTDIIMPEMEGIETIRALVKSKPNLPIIAITASIDTSYLQIALKLGAFFGLYKPFKQAELLFVVRKALEKTD
ncbi:MAG: response regulator [bacterium]